MSRTFKDYETDKLTRAQRRRPQDDSFCNYLLGRYEPDEGHTHEPAADTLRIARWMVEGR